MLVLLCFLDARVLEMPGSLGSPPLGRFTDVLGRFPSLISTASAPYRGRAAEIRIGNLPETSVKLPNGGDPSKDIITQQC
jgi:hypothetical protein